MPPPAVAPLPLALRRGLVFIHLPKAGGSTFGGVMRRIAYRRGLAHARDHGWLGKEAPGEQMTPALFADHGVRGEVGNRLVVRMPGALFVTMLRNPIDRCLSAFYHLKVTRDGWKPSQANKLNYIRSDCSANSETNIVSRPAYGTKPEAVLMSYGFVGLMERFDESLLLFAKGIGVGQLDLLYLKSKVAGSGTDPLTRRGMSEHPPLSSEPPDVQRLAKEKLGWGPDARLVKAANAALDMHIAQYGPSFSADLKEFQNKLAIVAERCQSRFWESCLYDDSGCGQDCIEEVATALRWT